MTNFKKSTATRSVALTALLSCALVGCEAPTPVDPLAVKHCLDKGWMPSHFSNGVKTQFECIPLELVKQTSAR